MLVAVRIEDDVAPKLGELGDLSIEVIDGGAGGGITRTGGEGGDGGGAGAGGSGKLCGGSDVTFAVDDAVVRKVNDELTKCAES